MKRAIRLCCALLALTLTLLLAAGCGQKETWAIRVEGLTVSENDYARTMSLLRTNYLYAEGAEDTAEFWNDQAGSGGTRADELTEYVNDRLIDNKLYALQFDKLGLSFTESEEQTIMSALSEAVESYGGMTAFNEMLAQADYTYEEYLTEIYDSAKKSKVLNHYYGDDGVSPVDVQDLKDYYNLHNALVKAIFIQKVDSEGAALTGDELAAAKQKADDAYAAASQPSETDQFDEFISVYSDDTSTQGSPAVIAEGDGTDNTLSATAFKMEIGAVELVELDSVFVILKRYDGGDDEYFNATVRQSTLETVRADEIDAMLQEWREAAAVKINNKLIKRYRPENMIDA